MHRILCLTALISSLLMTNVLAMDQEDFEDYLWGRAGNGEITHRVSTGWAYDIHSGNMVARLEGHEVAVAVPSRAHPGTIYHISRAMLLYRHPETDAVLAAYPESDPDAATSVSAFSYSDGALVWRLGSLTDDSAPRIMPGHVDCERQGPVLSCLRATSYASDQGRTVLEYRWMVDRTAPSLQAAARAEFAETEPPDPALSAGPIMIRLSSYRSPTWDAVPESLRTWIETEAPGFAILPEDVGALIEAADFPYP